MSNATAETRVRLDIVGGVATLTLDGPSSRNALAISTCDEFIQVLDEVENDPLVGALVITGAGEAFCSGADRGLLRDAVPLTAESADRLARVYETFARVRSAKLLTIAAVGGAAIGAGLNLALAADLRVVATDARLASGFSALGLHPGGGHIALISQLAGREGAAAIAGFGATLRGDDAVRAGLAWAAVEANAVLPRAQQLASAAGEHPALARQFTASLRSETGGGDELRVAIGVERAAQMWSLLTKVAR